MRYYYVMLAFAFSLSLMLSVAHAGESFGKQKAHARQTSTADCARQKPDQKASRACTAKRAKR